MVGDETLFAVAEVYATKRDAEVRILAVEEQELRINVSVLVLEVVMRGVELGRLIRMRNPFDRLLLAEMDCRRSVGIVSFDHSSTEVPNQEQRDKSAHGSIFFLCYISLPHSLLSRKRRAGTVEIGNHKCLCV